MGANHLTITLILIKIGRHLLRPRDRQAAKFCCGVQALLFKYSCGSGKGLGTATYELLKGLGTATYELLKSCLECKGFRWLRGVESARPTCPKPKPLKALKPEAF